MHLLLTIFAEESFLGYLLLDQGHLHFIHASLLTMKRSLLVASCVTIFFFFLINRVSSHQEEF